MRITFQLDSQRRSDVRKAARMIEILSEAGKHRARTLKSPPTSPPRRHLDGEHAGRITRLAGTRTGEPLQRAAQRFAADEQFTLIDLAGLMAWETAKAKSWFAKFSRTCLAWKIDVLQRHPGTPKRYSMSKTVRQAVLNCKPALVVHQQTNSQPAQLGDRTPNGQ
jgi:hypothetical protein